MNLWRAFWVAWGNVARNKRSFVLASFGLIVGIATFTFFVALGGGIKEGVLNRIYPVNQVEVEPKTVGLVGIREQVVDEQRLGEEMVETFADLPGVTHVYPKLRSKLQARLWGGRAIFGYDARAEAFFDGLDPDLVRSELKEMERVEEKRAQAALRTPQSCVRDDECPLGQECGDEGRCADTEYWRRFADYELLIPCAAQGETEYCPEGTECLAGACQVPCAADGTCGEGQACVPALTCETEECPGTCRPVCTSDAECTGGQVCQNKGAASVCAPLRCKLAHPKHQYSERPGDRRGTLMDRCANEAEPGSAACAPEPCPAALYCAPTSVKATEGVCEYPIPAIFSPFLIEVFNSSAASALGLQPIDGTDALLGVQFRIQLGDSYFTDDLPKEVQAVKRAEIVGFSDKAQDFGLTMPLSYVRAINLRYKGRDAADNYNTFILETAGNEDVSNLIAEVEDRGFTLGRKSRDARKAADLLFILTVVFSFISVVIMFVAAVNITHTFLTLVTERRHEIGIMRAVGATRWDVRLLILLEATFLGLFGGALGNLVSYGFSRLVNVAAAEFLEGIPFKPDDFFHYDWQIIAGAMAFAWVFCMLGAFLPANRAAKLDPAVVLTS